ncbi:conserved membrane hypothetical protein [Mesorhizobium sp. STM 4661]|nr:conserved membrane hypothetical protein [Mesorhizobium sp. STM 4661]
MAVLIQVARLVARMIMVLAGHLLLAGLIAVAVLIEIAGRVARVIVMFAGHLLLADFVTVAVLITISGRMSRMVVMLAGLFLWHCILPCSSCSGGMRRPGLCSRRLASEDGATRRSSNIAPRRVK